MNVVLEQFCLVNIVFSDVSPLVLPCSTHKSIFMPENTFSGMKN